MSTCFFIGHRDTPDSILPSLSAAIEKRITEDGVDQFVVGHYGKFDSLAAQAVRKAKNQHPDERLNCSPFATNVFILIQIPLFQQLLVFLFPLAVVPHRFVTILYIFENRLKLS